MPPVFSKKKDSTVTNAFYVLDFAKFFAHHKGRKVTPDSSPRPDPGVIPESSRSKIDALRDLITSATSEGAMYETLERILTRACLDLTPADAEEVLIFVRNATTKLRVQADEGEEKPDLIGFHASRGIANKIADGSLSDQERKSLKVPSAYLIVCAVEVKHDAIETLQSMRYIFVLSRHSPATHLQYGLSINEKNFKLLCLGLDTQQEWPRIPWTAEDYISFLYYYVSLIFDSANQRFGGVPKFRNVVELKERRKAIGLYTIQLGGVDHCLLPIFVGRANGRKSFVALASAGKDDELKVVKFIWHPDGKGREFNHLKKLSGVPGVVQMDESFSVEALATNGEGRTRSMLVLKTVGYSISSCRTVLEFLEAMYDLLEVLRYLVDEKKIMHRDVSWSNVLILPDDDVQKTQVQVNEESSGSGKDNLAQAGTSSGNGVQHNYRYIANIFKETHFRVRVALADFDFATDLEKDKDELKDATGTPMFMANDLIRLRDVRNLANFTPIMRKMMRRAAMGHFNKYADDLEAAEWDEYYKEKIVALDWLVDLDREEKPELQFQHCAVHDAESVYYLCLLFFSRIWPYGAMVKAGEVEQLKIDRGTIFETLVKKQAGYVSFSGMGDLPAEAFPTGDRFAPFYDMLNTIEHYLWIPWFAARESQRGHRYEFHLHDFMQRLLIKEIKRLRDSGDPIELEMNPLPIVAASQYSGDHFTTSARALAVSDAGPSRKDSGEGGPQASGKRRGQTVEGANPVNKRAKTNKAKAERTIDNELGEGEDLGAEDGKAASRELGKSNAVGTETAGNNTDEDDVLPVLRPKRASVPEELRPFFSEKAWDVFWRKKREKLWLVADKKYK